MKLDATNTQTVALLKEAVVEPLAARGEAGANSDEAGVVDGLYRAMAIVENELRREAYGYE